MCDDFNSREQRWGSMVKAVEAEFSRSINHDESRMVRCRGKAAASATNCYLSVLSAPLMASHSDSADRFTASAYKMKFREWIRLHKINAVGDAVETKKYFERSVRLVNSLVLKIIVTVVKSGKVEMDVATHPSIITAENIMVHQSIDEGEAAYFIDTESKETSNLHRDDVARKYLAMKALGILAYDLFMRGVGPPVSSFLPSIVTDPGCTTRFLLSIDEHSCTSENQLDEGNRGKRSRGIDRTRRTISNAMINAGVPYPLCRFVIDLLGGECSDGLLFRSDNAFQSFSDVLSDLSQMMKNPEAFIHLSVKDRWKLAFGEKLHGRAVEKKMIMDVASRVTGSTSNDALFEALALLRPQNKQQIVMCYGKPGSGKSRFVMETRKDLENQGWLFLSCKFERMIHAEPLSIIASAFDEFLENCLGEPRYHYIQVHLKKLIMLDDISVLIKHVPSLVKYLDGPLPPPDDLEVSQEQMHQLFCHLLVALSLSGQPVAFFMDDLQWADTTSTELFIAFSKAGESVLPCVGTQQKCQIMLIGSYRDNEVVNDHQVAQMLQQLKLSSSVEMTDISVCGFARDTLNQIVSESLCLPLRRTKSLSEIILQKTDGIVIHIIEFIGRLMIDRILCHSFLKGWEWDNEVIQVRPMSESVAELFTFKLKMLPTDALRALQICSLFGIQIEKRVVNYIQDFDRDETIDIHAGLKVALDMGLIEIAGTTHAFKFAHDIIAQATFDLISEEERAQLLQKLASALVRNASAANELDIIIFVAVDLINRTREDAVTDRNLRLLYARLNDQAGKKALSVADFGSAVKYSESGLSFLGIDHLEDKRELRMSLYQTSVVALYSCTNGNQALLKERIDLVFQHAASLEEEFKTRYVWIRLLSTSSLQKAIDECHALLERLVEPIDSSNNDFTLISNELVRVKESFLKNKQRFSSLTRMVNPDKLKAMKIMSLLVVLYHYNRCSTAVMVCSRMVEMSMKYGFCEDSIFGLASFASTLVAILSDVEEGCSCARMALTLVSSCRNVKVLLPAVYLAVYSVVLIWREPIQATLDPILHGCRLAFEYGNIQFAVYNVQLYFMRSFLSGKKIDVLLNEIDILTRRSALHGQNPLIQTVSALINNVLRDLKGLDEQAMVTFQHDITNGESQCCHLHKTGNLVFENQLLLGICHSFLFRNMEKAQGMSDVFERDITTKGLLLFNHAIFEFYSGLLACHFGRKTEEEHWKGKAKSSLKRMQHFSSLSKWNFENKFLLLKAEYYNTYGESSEAAKWYEAAVISARNHKLLHEEAIACELAGYFYGEQRDKTKSNLFFLQANRAYMKWGAYKKSKSVPQG